MSDPTPNLLPFLWVLLANLPSPSLPTLSVENMDVGWYGSARLLVPRSSIVSCHSKWRLQTKIDKIFMKKRGACKTLQFETHVWEVGINRSLKGTVIHYSQLWNSAAQWEGGLGLRGRGEWSRVHRCPCQFAFRIYGLVSATDVQIRD